jgi:four helix bundle protein
VSASENEYNKGNRMDKATSVEDLKVFQKAHTLALSIYKISNKFPGEEKFGLVSQMRRAASSIPANLMEGSHRSNKGEYRQFAGIARGSAGELKYHLLLSKDLGYLSEQLYDTFKVEIDEISKMLSGLVRSLS